tara:strand:- start:2600 stop:3208 length:609 start_codon:yes stop_codon:yes gene_type:complete
MEKKVLIELFIDDKDQDNALDMISFVSAPAIEKDFMHFKEQKEKFEFKSDEEKRIVTGAAMIPNQEIIRMDAEDKPYFVYFTEETIEKAQEVFAKYGKTKSTNFEHKTGMRDVTVVESWIVTDPSNDKSNALGFSDIPKGSWMVSYKVDNDELWKKVKDGEVKGFSIEGVFSKSIIQMSKHDSDNSNFSFDDFFSEVYKLLD